MYEGSWHAKVTNSAEMSKELNEGAIIQCHHQLLHTTFQTKSVKMYLLKNFEIYFLVNHEMYFIGHFKLSKELNE